MKTHSINIALSFFSYLISRYHCNSSILWHKSDFQKKKTPEKKYSYSATKQLCQTLTVTQNLTLIHWKVICFPEDYQLRYSFTKRDDLRISMIVVWPYISSNFTQSKCLKLFSTESFWLELPICMWKTSHPCSHLMFCCFLILNVDLFS